jgi:hypothetical protein
MILKSKFSASCNVLYILPLLLMYSCNKYPHHKRETIDGGIVLNYNYKGDISTGKYDAEVTAYYPSGELNSRYKVINGKIEGVRINYYKNGTIKSQSNFKDGKLDGINKLYYENGQINAIGSFLYNKRNGLSSIYYPNGKLSHFGLFKDSIVMYSLGFDTTGKKIMDHIVPYANFPKTIRLGEKFRLEVTYPLLKGFTNINEFNIALIPENIYTIDSLQDYQLYSIIKNKKWIYRLINRKKKITINNFKGPLINIPMNNNGYGVYEFTPSIPGKYCFIGISATFNSAESKEDTNFAEDHIKLNFTVTK